ncbi:MAG: hypothetical protein P8X90_06670, partial [Desulfobacterales bacterium]
GKSPLTGGWGDANAGGYLSREIKRAYKKSKLPDRLTVRFMHFISRMIARTGIAVPAQASLVREIYRRYGTPGLTVYSAMVERPPQRRPGGYGRLDAGVLPHGGLGSDHRRSDTGQNEGT